MVLGLLAVLLAICSEADAFVAASLTQFSLTARLAFMVVGPIVDVKLIALQAGTFGPKFAVRFAPATFVVAILCQSSRRMVAAVRRNVAGLVVVFVGAAVVQLATSNTYLRYVKPGMRWMLLAAGVILIVLAVADVLADTRKKPATEEGVTTMMTATATMGCRERPGCC